MVSADYLLEGADYWLLVAESAVLEQGKDIVQPMITFFPTDVLEDLCKKREKSPEELREPLQ